MKLLNKIFPFLVLVVILIGFLLRAQAFIRGDFFFFQDQSRDLLLVKDVVEKGNVMLIGSRTGFGGLFHGPIWVYSLIPAFVLSGGNPYWTFIPTDVFYSLFIIIGGFFVGWKLYSKWIGLLFSFFLAISAPLIASIYYMTDAHVTPLIFLAFLYSLIKYFRGDNKYFVGALFFTGIGFQFEPAFAVLLLPISAVALFLKRKTSFKVILLGILALLLSVSNFLLFDLRHKFLMTNTFLNLFNGKLGALPGYENYQKIDYRIQDRIINAINSFFTPIYSKDFLPILLIILITIFSLFLVFRKLKNKENKEIIFLFLFPFISYLFYVFYPYPLWDHYVLPLVISVALFLSLSIKKISSNFVGFIISLVFIVSVLTPVTNVLFASYKNYSKQNIPSDSSYQNQLEVAKWILKDSDNHPFNYLVYNPSTFTYGMDYLFSWKKLVDDRTVNKCSKGGLTYLIFYPHLKGDDNAYLFWKENVIKTRSVPIFTKKFNGNITVEKLNITKSEPDIDINYCQNLLFR